MGVGIGKRKKQKLRKKGRSLTHKERAESAGPRGRRSLSPPCGDRPRRKSKPPSSVELGRCSSNFQSLVLPFVNDFL